MPLLHYCVAQKTLAQPWSVIGVFLYTVWPSGGNKRHNYNNNMRVVAIHGITWPTMIHGRKREKIVLEKSRGFGFTCPAWWIQGIIKIRHNSAWHTARCKWVSLIVRSHGDNVDGDEGWPSPQMLADLSCDHNRRDSTGCQVLTPTSFGLYS
jgi:hypothetical protein